MREDAVTAVAEMLRTMARVAELQYELVQACRVADQHTDAAARIVNELELSDDERDQVVLDGIEGAGLAAESLVIKTAVDELNNIRVERQRDAARWN